MGLTHDYDHQVTYAPEKNEHPSIRTEQLSTFATATELSLIAEAMEEIKSKGILTVVTTTRISLRTSPSTSITNRMKSSTREKTPVCNARNPHTPSHWTG